MCSLIPLKTLKCIVALSGWITILLGLTSFIAGIILQVKTMGSGSEFFKNFEG